MLLYLLFAVAALGEECETSTCFVCKNTTGCDWYGYSCLNSTSSIVTTLTLTPSATCDVCQAGSCGDCQKQDGCSWFASSIPGIGGKCAVNTSTPTTYSLVNTCPTCKNYDSLGCNACVQANCSWYTSPGGVSKKCREASPSFAYTQVPNDSCDTGNRCAGIESCALCQATNVTSNANASACAWYQSKSPRLYDAKCDDSKAGVIDNQFYTSTVSGSCPACAGTSCSTCKAETGCRWAAVKQVPFGTAFGQCLKSTDDVPQAKTVLDTCPSDCDVHSCKDCIAKKSCNWFASDLIGDSCDLATDTLQHSAQTPIPSAGHETCGACQANRCYECNNLPNCGWYVEKFGPLYGRGGCYATDKIPSGRVLRPNTDSKCDGVPSSSAHVVASIGVLVLLGLLA